MEIKEAEKLAKELIAKYCSDYSFKFNNRKKAFGVCSSREKWISLSKPLVKLNDKARVTNTILHEIAHALVGCVNGHNYIWKRKAIEIGCDGERCFNSIDVNVPRGKYVYECPNCKKETHQFRKTKRVSACGDCCRNYNYGRFTSEYALRLKVSEGGVLLC